MKVLITTDMYTANVNGVVTSVKNLIEELEKKGHDVRVLTVSEKLKSHKDGNVYFIKSVSLEAVYPKVRMPTSYRHRFITELAAGAHSKEIAAAFDKGHFADKIEDVYEKVISE